MFVFFRGRRECEGASAWDAGSVTLLSVFQSMGIDDVDGVVDVDGANSHALENVRKAAAV